MLFVDFLLLLLLFKLTELFVLIILFILLMLFLLLVLFLLLTLFVLFVVLVSFLRWVADGELNGGSSSASSWLSNVSSISRVP